MLKSGVHSAPLRLPKPDLKTINYIFDSFSPTPHLCFDKIWKPDNIEQYRQTIKTALWELTPHKLQMLVKNSGNLSTNKICLIRRNDQVQPSDDVANITLIMDFVKFQLVTCLQNLQIEEQVHLYNQFSKVPSKEAWLVSYSRCIASGISKQWYPSSSFLWCGFQIWLQFPGRDQPRNRRLCRQW